MMVLSLGLLVCMTLISRAEDDGKKKESKAGRRAELLKKYDKNGDGKLDDSELAAMKEDRRKTRKEHKESEPKKEEKH